MIVPSIYSQSEAQISKDLLPPFRRGVKWLAWFTAILTPLQWLHDLVFTDYYAGSSAVNWASGNTYNYGDRVKYVDYAIYESINTSAFVSTTAPPLDIYNVTTGVGNWIKVLDTFVGVAERVRYNGKLIMLEWLLNQYFRGVGALPAPSFPFQGASHVNQIYISKNYVNSSDMWMAISSDPSIPNSYMPINSKFAVSYMPITSTAFNANSFTINVPAAVATAITTSITTAIPGSLDTYKTLITNIVSNYVRAGRSFAVTTY